MEKEVKKKTAVTMEEIQEQQYTADEAANKVIEEMFDTFVKPTFLPFYWYQCRISQHGILS